MLLALLLSGTVNVVAQEARPIGNPGLWITTDDYPAAALQGDMQGVTAVQMSISADGAVTGCTVTLSSGHPILDDLTCNLLRMRAHYEPAKDRRGRAIASQTDKRVRWQLPDEEEVPRQPTPFPFAVIVDFDVNEQGKSENCKTRWQVGLPSEMDYCSQIEQSPVEPFRNDKGVPIRKHVTYRTSIAIEDAPDAGHPPADDRTSQSKKPD